MISKISLTPEQEANINELVEEHYRDVPLFYDEGICEVLFIPVEGAELRVLHHKPKNSVTQRPVLFVSGFGTSPWSWRHFNTPLYDKGEYYFLETREKSTSKILTKRRKTNLTIDQHAKDLAIVIKHLGFDTRDFILFGTSFSGGAMVTGLAKNYFTAPTVVVHDPLVDWKVQKRLLRKFALIPNFILEALKMPLVRLVLLRMKNKSAKERYIDFIRKAHVWKWKKTGFQNLKYKLAPLLLELQQHNLLIVHGTKDKYHNDEVYEEIAKEIPNGRYLYMNSPNEFRELIVGIIAFELAKSSATKDLPDVLKQFEVKLAR